MIEWLSFGAVALIGNVLGSSSKRNSSSGGSAVIARLIKEGSKKQLEARALTWREAWEREVDRTRWIPQSSAHLIAEAYPYPNSDSAHVSLHAKEKVVRELLAEFATHNLAHLAAQKASLKRFFDAVEASPLTEEQAEACICMDDAVQIVAAAGSGKTSTMVAKTGYILREGLAKPEEILLLAFNAKAAKELDHRLRQRLKGVEGLEKVTVSTFHAFGLNQVLGKSRGIAKWVGSPVQENEMITEIVGDLRKRDPSFGLEWDIFRTVYGRAVNPQGDAIQPQGDGRGKIRTADGTWVKSHEERMIADWLFFHGVRYAYERDYEHPTRTQTHQQYRPDFYYPDAKLYHEHFALDHNGNAPAHFTGDYVNGVRWKRQCHALHQTALFETTSHTLRNGAALECLAAALRQRGVELAFDAERPTKGQPSVTTLELAGLVRTFQQHAKGSGVSIGAIRTTLDKSNAGDAHVARVSRFLSLYERISAEWERRLQRARCIDFDDMLIQAAERIESGTYQSPYKIILADEFQDSSRTRVRLLKALLDQTDAGGHLCVVGDDWQSINRFAGSDISVMTEFKATFPHSSQLKLTTTFRCPQSLCDASSRFVSANPNQIAKEVKTTNPRKGPSIVAYAFPSSEETLEGVENHLARLYNQAASGDLDYSAGSLVSVLLLGRYNHDRPSHLEKWQIKFGSQLQIEFRTIHSAKGLEADYVMILNMVEDDAYGFPSLRADDPILRLAMPECDTFPMAEERRIFYVAMTRARRQVRIYTKDASPSRFLVEMAREGTIDIRLSRGLGNLQPCLKCKRGALTKRSGPHGSFECCMNCGYKRSLPVDHIVTLGNRVALQIPMTPGTLCPTCGEGTMVERPKRFSAFVGCDEYPKCKTTAPLRID